MAKKSCFRAQDLSLAMCKRREGRIRIVSVEKTEAGQKKVGFVLLD